MTDFSPTSRGSAPLHSRLKDPPLDPLESIGLPSKGDNSLLDFKIQEIYYKKVVDRYKQYNAAIGWGQTLDDSFASLSLSRVNLPRSLTPFKSTGHIGLSGVDVQRTRELSVILLAMRKIREAVVASSRTDLFALRAYIFIIRAAISTNQVESYHPALSHLLYKLHPCSSLSAPEEHEFVGYYILDLSCRQSDLARAFEVRNAYRYRDATVEMVLRALVHGNWLIFWKIEQLADIYQKRLIEYGEDKVRKNALRCLGRSYLSVEKAYVERVAGRDWEKLREQECSGWDLEGETITIRRMKRK